MRLKLLTLTILLALLVACGGGETVEPTAAPEVQATSATGGETATTEPAETVTEGTILIDGSSTVAPITSAIAEEFQIANPGMRVPVGVSGTGGGFKKFCAGETDISNASRPIKDTEMEECAAAGIEFIELPIAYDGLAVVVNPANEFAACLTVDQLKMMWEPAAEGVVMNWNQIDPSFPDTPINLYGPGVDSGTYDYFTGAIVGEEGASRGDFLPSEDDNVLVQGVSGDEGGIGFFGLAYYEQNADKLKLLEVDGGEGCVAPSTQTVADGSYQPLSRPMFIYVNKASAENRPELASFINFFMTNADAITGEVGYISLGAEIYGLTTKRFEEKITGTMFEGGSMVGVTLSDLLAGEKASMEEESTMPTDLEGTILIDGSSTVAPVTSAVAEEFQIAYPGMRVPVGVSGTGGGFKKFCAGETDISNASRPIKTSEAEECAAAGVEFIELPIAYDGLAVVVNPANEFASCLTVDQLKMMWEPAAEGVVMNWNQIDPSFPDTPINLYGPGVDSGTYDYFTGAIVGEEGASRGDFLPSEDDNVLVQGVSGDEGAIGFFGLAYYEQNKDKLKLLEVDGGDGCIAPSTETVGNGTYQPLSRPIFIYVNKASAESRPELAAFVNFFMVNAGVLSAEVGYISLGADIYALATARFAAGTAGSMFEGGSTVGVSLMDSLSK